MIRNLLKGSLAAAVLYFSQPAQAQESVTVQGQEYSIQDRVIYDKKGNRITSQNTLRDVMYASVISKEFQDYLPVAEKNLGEFNRSKTLAQLTELFRSYSAMLKTPIETLVEGIKEGKFSLKEKIELIKQLYEGAEREFIALYTDERMYIYAELTAHTLQAENDYRQLIKLLKSGLKSYESAKQAMDLLLESEHILKASPKAFDALRKQKPKDDKEEKERFRELLKEDDIVSLEKICREKRAKARSSKEYKDYIQRLIDEKGNSPAYRLQQEIRREGLVKIFSQ